MLNVLHKHVDKPLIFDNLKFVFDYMQDELFKHIKKETHKKLHMTTRREAGRNNHRLIPNDNNTDIEVH